MSRRLRDETGATLIAAVLIVLAMLGFGLALLAATDGQTRSSARERTRESAFNLAEAALNAHALQLTRTWVSTPLSACTTTATDTRCPQASAVSNGYTTGDYGVACPSDTTKVPWETSIRDNAANEQYWTSTVTNRAAYDANGDGVVWLRSTATSKCHTISMVSLVSQASVPIQFPSNVVTANWFKTSNQGRKVIVDTRGSASQPAPITVRCAGLSTAQCLNYPADKGQVQPPAVKTDTAGKTQTLSDSELASLASQAQAAGTYWSTGCPSTPAQLASVNGAPVYVKGPCSSPPISVTGNTSINSPTSPGVLIIEDGALTLSGNIQFYGLIYMVNKQGSSGSLLNIHGTATVHGVVSVDGAGGLTAGASKANLIFDPKAATLLKANSGATLNKNSFRVVPSGS
jgi:Tfp pilus assembly protein PilX